MGFKAFLANFGDVVSAAKQVAELVASPFSNKKRPIDQAAEAEPTLDNGLAAGSSAQQPSKKLKFEPVGHVSPPAAVQQAKTHPSTSLPGFPAQLGQAVQSFQHPASTSAAVHRRPPHRLSKGQAPRVNRVRGSSWHNGTKKQFNRQRGACLPLRCDGHDVCLASMCLVVIYNCFCISPVISRALGRRCFSAEYRFSLPAPFHHRQPAAKRGTDLAVFRPTQTNIKVRRFGTSAHPSPAVWHPGPSSQLPPTCYPCRKPPQQTRT